MTLGSKHERIHLLALTTNGLLIKRKKVMNKLTLFQEDKDKENHKEDEQKWRKISVLNNDFLESEDEEDSEDFDGHSHDLISSKPPPRRRVVKARESKSKEKPLEHCIQVALATDVLRFGGKNNFKAKCQADTALYGQGGSTRRKQVQNRRNYLIRLRSKDPQAFFEVCETLGIDYSSEEFFIKQQQNHLQGTQQQEFSQLVTSPPTVRQNRTPPPSAASTKNNITIMSNRYNRAAGLKSSAGKQSTYHGFCVPSCF